MKEIILEGKQIVKDFALKKEVFWEKKKTLRAVAGVDVQLGRGQTIGIVGESGSGKSTLGEILGGLQSPPPAAAISPQHSVHLPESKGIDESVFHY